MKRVGSKRKYNESSYGISDNNFSYGDVTETFGEQQSTNTIGKMCEEDNVMMMEEEEVEETKKIINYEDELVMFIYYYLIEIIIDNYKVIPSTIKIDVVDDVSYEDECNVIINDFYNIDLTELKMSDILYVRDSKVIYSKLNVKKGQSKQRYSKVSFNNNVNNNGGIKSKSVLINMDLLGEESSFNESYWMVPYETETVFIKYKNGNVYEGTTYRKLYHGNGIFRWNDGVTYEGEFHYGDATGNGTIYLSDLSYYNGSVCKGLLHGIGTLYVNSSPLLYHGSWKAGKKDGKGWLLYGNNNWYDGEWKDNNRHGWGCRQYEDRIRYKGNWCNGSRNGLGTMVYCNGDFYTGEWKLGLNDGYGEYTWRAFLNKSFSFPVENIFQGLWANGTRDGAGIMNFGIDCGVRLTGLWRKNQKNGPGIIICRNGSVAQGSPLFVADKPIHVNRYDSMSELHRMFDPEESAESIDTTMKNLSSFEFYSRQLFTKHSVTSISDIPQYTPMCDPIKIPVYAPPETICLKRYINKIANKFTNMKTEMYKYVVATEERSRTTTNRKWNVSVIFKDVHQMKLNAIDRTVDANDEEMLMRRYLRNNANRLRKLYNYYASLCHNGPIEFDIILIRLFFWQLYRDIGIGINYHYSLVEIDEVLFDNKDIGFELIHNPFEKIYYWQFLHCLIELSLTLFDNYVTMIDYKRDGILACIFDKFFTELFTKNCQSSQENIYNPYAYLNLLPIESVYLLYESVGQPHTARTFLKNCIYEKGHPLLPLTKTYDWTNRRESVEGKNMIPVGENLTFYSISDKLFNIREEIVPIEELYFKYLYVFRHLGAKRIVHCLSTVCPLIVIDCVIVNMEYKLTFLEFYETLIFCSYMMISDEKEKEYKERAKREEEEQTVNDSKEIH